MVKHNDTALNRTFAALADPTRRAMLASLGDAGGLSVSDLARPFHMSLPAAMKHIDVLAEAGLVIRVKTGRTVRCSLAAGPMEDAMQWLSRYQRFWTERLDRLAAFVEEIPCPLAPAPQATPIQASPSQASPSNAVSMRGRSASTRRGRIPRKS